MGCVYCLLVQTEDPCNNFAVKFQTNIYLKEETKWEEHQHEIVSVSQGWEESM